jgi:hypothetical protein
MKNKTPRCRQFATSGNAYQIKYKLKSFLDPRKYKSGFANTNFKCLFRYKKLRLLPWIFLYVFYLSAAGKLGTPLVED